MERPTKQQLQSFRGGLAEKLGNTFESDWAVLQALLVLQSEAQSIMVEPLVVAEGFEFVLHTNTGPEYHQCKRRGPKARNWTIGGIAQTDFWSSAISKHEADTTASFVFVSIDSSGEASRLAEHASRFDTLSEFQAALSKEDRTALSELVTQASLRDDEAAFSFLKQIRFETVSELSLRQATSREARRVFRGEGGATCDVLRRCLNDHLSRTLTTQRLRELAAERGLVPRPAALDATTLERMARQNSRYEESHGALGVGGEFIRRTIAQSISDELQPSGETNFVALTGVAGSGKSGVLRQVAMTLEAQGVPCLRVRLDSVLHFASADDLGAYLFGPHESPALTLSLAAPEDGFAVLMLDQLDAISEASGRTVEARELALDLISDARHYANLKVVVACRSYDLQSDSRLRNLGEGPRSKKFNADLLDIDSEIKPFLLSIGVQQDGISAKQWDLIRLPINLVHFAQLSLETGSVIGAGSTAELYRALLDKRTKDLRDYNLPWSVSAALGTLAERMSETRSLTAPTVLLDGYARAAELLVSGHLLNPDGDVVRFAHESLFDYCFARAFIRRGQSLITWLMSDEQILFRRTQVRQVLELLRSAEPERYLVELDALLQEAAIRAHIKDAVASWLGTLTEPTVAELDICLKHDSGVGRPSFIPRRAFAGAGWVRLLNDKGLLAPWLASADEDRKQSALQLLDIALDGQARLSADTLRAWWDRDPKRIPDLLQWLKFPRHGNDIDPVADLYQEVIAQTPDAFVKDRALFEVADLGMWAHQGSPAVPRLLAAWIDRWYRANPRSHPFSERDSDAAYWLREAAKLQPVEFLQTMLGAFATAFDREIAEDESEPGYSQFRVQLPEDNEEEKHEDRHILDIVRSTLRGAAKNSPEAIKPALDLLRPAKHLVAVHLILEAIDAGGMPMTDVARRLFDDPLLFKAGFEEGPSDSGARAIASVWDALEPSERVSLERRILLHFPEIEEASEQAHREDGPKRRKYALMYLGNVGAAQRNILARIGEARLSSAARHRLLELSRKFPRATWPESHSRGGFVASPISLEQAKRMSDRHWLRAFEKYKKPRDERRFTRRGVFGGLEQLARVLQECTKTDPVRFVTLAERLPAKTPPDYTRAVIRGIAECETTLEVVERVAHLASSSSDPETADTLSYLVSKHPILGRIDAKFDEMEQLALRLPSPEDLTPSAVRRIKTETEQTIEDLVHASKRYEGLALNSKRGDAIHALAAMLWEAPQRYTRVLQFTKNAIKTETSKAMRVALVRCVNAITGQNPDQGLALLAALAGSDSAPLATSTGLSLVSYAFWNRRETGLALLDKLFAVEEFRPAALYLLAHYAIDDDDAAARFEPMWTENPIARRMAAYAAVRATADVHTTPNERAEQWLERLFHDADEQVLREAAGFGRNLGGAGREVREKLALAHIASPSFRVDPDDMLHGLDQLGAEFPDLVVAACKAFFEAEKDDTFSKRQRGGAGRHWLSKMIFAAYPALEKKPAYRAQILDIIDLFLTSDLADARRELGQFDRH